MSNKSIAELEEERMARFVNAPANSRQPVAFKKPAAEPAPEPKAAPSPRQWGTPPAKAPSATSLQKAPSAPRSTNEVRGPQPVSQAPREAPSLAQSGGATLDGKMDLSTRVEYLNSLYEQGAINDDEYARRSEPLQVANEIIQACSAGNANQLQQLLNAHPSMDMDSIVEKEATPLYCAVIAITKGRGNAKVLSLLCTRGAQPNRRKAGFTALLSLCERPNNNQDIVNCCQTLIEHGADAKATTIVSGKEPMSCISLAVEAGASPELIKLLCKNGASPNDQLQPHGPLLVGCIIEEQFALATALLECGADPNSRQSGLGASCLAISISNRYYEIAQQLLAHRADRDLPIMRNEKTTARQLVESFSKKDPGAFQRFERFF